MEKRLSGKNLSLVYPASYFSLCDLMKYLSHKLNKYVVNYILIGANKNKIIVFASIEKLINVRSGDFLNFGEIEGQYKVSINVSDDIFKILQTGNILVEGECDHPVYLIHLIKEKEKEKEKEILKKDYEEKLKIKELEFFLKLQENEKENNLKHQEKEKEKEELKNNYEDKLKSKESEFLLKLQEKNEQITEKLMTFLNDFQNECLNKNDSHFKTFLDENSKNLLLDLSKISNNDIQNGLNNQNEVISISKEIISLNITQNFEVII